MNCVTVSGCSSYGVRSSPPDGSTATIRDCTIRDNPGEGLRLHGDLAAPQLSSIEITGCTFTGNTGAGGRFLEDCDAEMIASAVTANSSTLGGGSCILARKRARSALTPSGTTQVTGNQASEGGSADLDHQKPPGACATVKCGTRLP